jgi:hypothetical protein
MSRYAIRSRQRQTRRLPKAAQGKRRNESSEIDLRMTARSA